MIYGGRSEEKVGHLAFEELRVLCRQLRNNSAIRGKIQVLESLEWKIYELEVKYFSSEDKAANVINKKPIKKQKSVNQSSKKEIDWAKVWKDELSLPV